MAAIKLHQEIMINIAKSSRALALSLLLIATFSTLVEAGPVSVIVHPDNPLASLTMTEVKQFYTDFRTSWPTGGKVKVYDLPMSDPAREAFSQKVLNKRAQDVAMEWANKRITNTAKNPPVTLRSPVLLQSKVSGNPLAIGYLPQEKVNDAKVKVVLVIP